MNNWGNDYAMQNQFGMPPMNQMMTPNMIQPLMPPLCMIGEMGQVNPAPSVGPQGMIGPVLPDGQAPPGESKNEDVQIISDGDGQNQNDPGSKELQPSKTNNHGSSRDRRNRRDQDHDRDNRRRSRSPGRFDRSSDRNRNDQGRGSRGRNDRSDRPRRDRPSKWSKNEDLEVPRPGNMGMGNNMMIQGMMPFNMMNNNMMGQQPMEMGNIQNMGNMQNMSNMQNMGNLQNMMPNMMPGMNNMNMMQTNAIMDPMMMMNQQAVVPSQPALIPNQPIYLNSCMLLPPIPGTSLPKRREMPPGCRTIFVGGLPTGIPEDIVHEIFQRFGGVDDIKLHRQGVCHVRFENHSSVGQSFFLSGYRFKVPDQSDNEATTIFIDYALNRDDQNEFERMKRVREKTPPRIEPFTPATLSSVTEKIKLDEEFIEVAPVLLSWLERGECNKKNANQFYSLIQAANHQVRRLYNEKMTLDDEFQTIKNELREKFAKVIQQFEQVAKILTVAKHQRVSDHFTKQQRRNIEMWLKMTEEVENIKEEFALYFDEEEGDKPAKGTALQEKYEELKQEHENLTYELEGYRNELHLAKDEAERKFEKFKAQFIAQQALQNPGKQIYPPLPPPATPLIEHMLAKPEPPPPTPDDLKLARAGPAAAADARLISLLTAFLLVHPLGATQDYLVSYVRSMVPAVSQQAVQQVLQRNGDVFRRKSKGYGHSTEHRWEYALFSLIKQEN